MPIAVMSDLRGEFGPILSPSGRAESSSLRIHPEALAIPPPVPSREAIDPISRRLHDDNLIGNLFGTKG